MNMGAYIQVPFCQTKCTYCNFHTGVVSATRYGPYATAVCREIEFWHAEQSAGGLEDARIDTVYCGGGTPSLLDPAMLTGILEALRSKLTQDAAPEVTLEADPETITSEKACAWLAAGFNRISLGVQSFDDLELKASGRLHRRSDVYRAAQFLREAGFGNINMDLIAGLPRQTHESWEQSLSELLGLRPEHISIYMLELDDGSRLGQESLAGGSRYSAGALPGDDATVEFYESACSHLLADGYEHYEISNWALPGWRSQHNMKYWRRLPYIGFGAGAHSFDGSQRWANLHDPGRYVTCTEQGTSTREQIETITREQALEEEFFLGLRQLEGIDLHRIEREYSGALNGRVGSLMDRIAQLRWQGLVELEGGRLRLAPDRLTVSNQVFTELLG
jgi:putative oxygen-independent coproporphyrinogen III oxidase